MNTCFDINRFLAFNSNLMNMHMNCDLNRLTDSTGTAGKGLLQDESLQSFDSQNLGLNAD